MLETNMSNPLYIHDAGPTQVYYIHDTVLSQTDLFCMIVFQSEPFPQMVNWTHK